MFCYQTEKTIRTNEKDSFFDPLKCDANKCYMDHYRNHLVLDFFAKNGTMQEMHQAGLELEICERKMKYWKRQPHFDHDLMIKEVAIANKHL